MNRTSPSSSFVRMAARSPARSSAGPEVTCSRTPISMATMPARRGLAEPRRPGEAAGGRRPGPGGGPPRARSPRCSFSSCWPTNSSSRRGRRLASSASSRSSAGCGLEELVTHGAHRQDLEGVAEHDVGVARRDRPRAAPRGSPPARSRARRAPRARRTDRRRASPLPWRRGRRHRASATVEAGSAARRSSRSAVFLPTPGTRHSDVQIAGDDVGSSCRRRVRGQDGQGQGRADAVGAEEDLERGPLVSAGKP